MGLTLVAMGPKVLFKRGSTVASEFNIFGSKFAIKMLNQVDNHLKMLFHTYQDKIVSLFSSKTLQSGCFRRFKFKQVKCLTGHFVKYQNIIWLQTFDRCSRKNYSIMIITFYDIYHIILLYFHNFYMLLLEISNMFTCYCWTKLIDH